MSYQLFHQKFFWRVICVGGTILCFSLLFFAVKKGPHQYPASVFIGGTEYHLEIAKTREDQAKGLGDRDILCQECAMLFVFDWPKKQGFWMEGMRFPLDIAWLLDDTVVHIERDVPLDSAEVFLPDTRASSVLEVNAGVLKDIRVGDTINFVRPKAFFGD